MTANLSVAAAELLPVFSEVRCRKQEGEYWTAGPTRAAVRLTYLQSQLKKEHSSYGSKKMAIGNHQIESYRVGVGRGVIGDLPVITADHVLVLTPVSLYHGIQPEIVILFTATQPSGVGMIFKRTEFDATILITLHEKYFASMYAVLRSEKPVNFTYEADHFFTDPSSPRRIRVTAVRITTETEPVGEGIDASALEG